MNSDSESGADGKPGEGAEGSGYDAPPTSQLSPSSSTPPTRPSRWRRGLRIILRVVAGLVAGLALAVAAFEISARTVALDLATVQSGELSSLVFARDGRMLRSYLGTDERWRLPVAYDEVSPWLVKATLAVEDQRFFEHYGVDPRAVMRAMWSNVTRGRTISGASTLSMQVGALGLPRSRSWGFKFRQVFRARQLELRLSKRALLEIYFTQVPYGGNVCGAEAAAQRYFNKRARDLTLSEAALLAGVPQSPTRLRPDRQFAAAMKRREHVLERMRDEGMISAEEFARVLAQTPRVGQFDAPMLAPHFADLVHARYPREVRVMTTLDLTTQRTLEAACVAHLKRLRAAGITNVAAVVLDNATGEVRALVGSADYNNRTIDGQVNGAVALRSPGSTLKPLIFAKAFDTGWLLPGTVLEDVPIYFRGYAPKNFDDVWNGLVAADRALALSLNIPAIRVLQQEGLERCLAFFRRVGLETVRQPSDELGLSVAIGTCQVRLLDLVGAYSMLARGGEYRPVVLRRDDGTTGPDWLGAMTKRETATTKSVAAGERVIGEGAVYFVNRVLADVQLRPPDDIAPELAMMRGVAWKTGTSSGQRDAWTIAYDGTHTVGVWVGNFDGKPSPVLTGARAAAPLALGVMRTLRENEATIADMPGLPPRELATATVCRESGRLASPQCPTTTTARMTASGRDHSTLCAVHQRVLLDAETSTVLCPRCSSGRVAVHGVVAMWPAETVKWLRENRPDAALPPPHYPPCPSVVGREQPRITSPENGEKFIIVPDRSIAGQKVRLAATLPPGSRRVFWFADGTLLGEVAADDAFFWTPTTGTTTLRAVDEFGRADSVTVSATDGL